MVLSINVNLPCKYWVKTFQNVTKRISIRVCFGQAFLWCHCVVFAWYTNPSSLPSHNDGVSALLFAPSSCWLEMVVGQNTRVIFLRLLLWNDNSLESSLPIVLYVQGNHDNVFFRLILRAICYVTVLRRDIFSYMWCCVWEPSAKPSADSRFSSVENGVDRMPWG